MALPIEILVYIGSEFAHYKDVLPLFKAIRWNPSLADYRRVFQSALDVADFDVLRLVMSDCPKIGTQKNLYKVFLLALQREGHEKLVWTLLSQIEPLTHDRRAVEQILLCSRDEVIRLFLRNPLTDMSDKSHALVDLCTRWERKDLFKLIMNHPNVNYSWNEILGTSAMQGYLDVVQTILSDTEVDPRGDENDRHSNDALLYAASGGHLDVVKYLLTDPRLNTKDRLNRALRQSATCIYSFEVFKYLMSDPRADPGENDNELFTRISHYCRDEVFDILVKHPKVDPFARNNRATVMCKFTKKRYRVKRLEKERSIRSHRVRRCNLKRNLSMCDMHN